MFFYGSHHCIDATRDERRSKIGAALKMIIQGATTYHEESISAKGEQGQVQGVGRVGHRENKYFEDDLPIKEGSSWREGVGCVYR